MTSRDDVKGHVRRLHKGGEFPFCPFEGGWMLGMLHFAGEFDNTEHENIIAWRDTTLEYG